MTVFRIFPPRSKAKARLFCSIACLFFLTVRTPYAYSSEHAFPFKSNDRNLDDKAIQRLRSFATDAQQNLDEIIIIEEPSLNLKKSSKESISAKVRALKILEVLVQNGVNPSRIQIQAGKPSDGIILVKSIVTKDLPELTKHVQSKPSDSASILNELSFNFASSSGQPLEVNEEKIKQFLNSAGQPGHDALVIEGFADATGQADFNKALSELRALSVYEILIRRGLPPYRIDPRGLGSLNMPSKAVTDEEKAAARKVNLRWKSDPKVAEIAKEAEKHELISEATQKQPNDGKPQLSEAIATETPPVTKDESKITENFSMDLLAFAGTFLPGPGLKDKINRGNIYGLGLGKSIETQNDHELRMALLVSFTSKFKAVESDRSGSIDMNTVQLRSDYIFTNGHIRPYAGLGLGAYKWKGTIEQTSSSNQNSGSKTDVGALAALGIDFELGKSIVLSPELSWHRIGGDFSEDLLGAQIFIRWRI